MKSPNIKYWIAPILFVISFIFAVVQKFLNGADLTDAFLNTYYHIAYFGTIYCLVAIGAGIVIAAGGVDLSTMGIATLTGIIFAVCHHAGFSILLCLLISFIRK